MDARKKRVLKAIVDSYIRDAEPIGSGSLAGKERLDVSPATLRSEMAALEDSGYLYSPHTSSGRVPTPAGYRFYVDELMRRRRLTLTEREAIGRAAGLRMAELNRLLARAGRILSELTHYAALATVTRETGIVIQRLELFLSDPFSLVMVAVLDGGFVENRLCRLPAPARQEDIQSLSSALSGHENPLVAPAQELCARAGAGWAYWPYVRSFLQSLSQRGEEVVVAGESQLLTHPEFHDLPLARRTLEYLSEHREDLTRRLSGVPDRDGVWITIGPENAAAELENTSVVMAGYRLHGGLSGTIGVIGPTRMDYGHLTSRLAYFAKILQSSLWGEENHAGPAGEKTKEP